MGGPYIREPRFTQWVCGADSKDGKIRLQEGWKDPVKAELDLRSVVDRMIDTREKCIHDALVKLGWTPPKEQHEEEKETTQ